mmetsp:Transcript_138/g.252  ORF Transcript_138/g.252 Transcript_138/m.252 type:complete len:462 (+) Transcript_138:109-1494(+)
MSPQNMSVVAPLSQAPRRRHLPAPCLRCPSRGTRQKGSALTHALGVALPAGHAPPLDQVGDVHRHLVDLSGIELLNVAQNSDVVVLDEVDGDALAAEAARAANAVDVELSVVRQVVADDQRHLLHIQTSAPEVGGDQDSAGTRPELLHDRVALLLGHVAVDGGHGEVRVAHLLRQPVHLLLGVAEDHRLGDRQRVVEVAQGVELPLLALHRHEELLDAFQGQLIALHKHAEGVVHELVGHLEDLVRHGGGNQDHLRGGREIAVDVIHLLLEAAVQHLICLIQHEHLDLAGAEVPLLDHVEDAARSAGDDVAAGLEGVDVIGDALAADAAVDLDVQVVAEGQANLLTLLGQLARGREEEDLRLALLRRHRLQRAQAEDARLARAALRLHDDVPALQDGQDGALLHGGRALEAVGVDAAEQVFLQAQRIEGRQHLHILGGLEDKALVVGCLLHAAAPRALLQP